MSFLKEEKHESFNERNMRLYLLIKEKKSINRYEAYNLLGWTPGIYDRVHPYFIARHSTEIIYKNQNYIYSPSIQEKLI